MRWWVVLRNTSKPARPLLILIQAKKVGLGKYKSGDVGKFGMTDVSLLLSRAHKQESVQKDENLDTIVPSRRALKLP